MSNKPLSFKNTKNNKKTWQKYTNKTYYCNKHATYCTTPYHKRPNNCKGCPNDEM